jgi:hypothetical protein
MLLERVFAMVRLPVRLPAAAGVKVTLIEQLAPAATLPGQLLVSAKSDAFVPPIATFVMLSAVDWLFVRVTLCDALLTLRGCLFFHRLLFRIPLLPRCPSVSVPIKGAYLYKDEASEKRVGPGDFLLVPGGHKHWSGGDRTEGALSYEEGSGEIRYHTGEVTESRRATIWGKIISVSWKGRVNLGTAAQMDRASGF